METHALLDQQRALFGVVTGDPQSCRFHQVVKCRSTPQDCQRVFGSNFRLRSVARGRVTLLVLSRFPRTPFARIEPRGETFQVAHPVSIGGREPSFRYRSGTLPRTPYLANQRVGHFSLMWLDSGWLTPKPALSIAAH